MNQRTPPLECRALCQEWMQELLNFLHALEQTGDSELFYPHPFTEAAIEGIIARARKDVYCVLVEGRRMVGYGMLRGWDAGFEIPSLGIAIHPMARGTGMGKALIHFLHTCARRRGAKTVRLRVKKGNSRALRLYQDLGYKFLNEEAGYLVGFAQFENRSNAGIPQ